MFAPQLPAQQLLSHAMQLHQAGNYTAAVDVYRQLLRSFPENPEILSKLGAALAAIGRTEEGRRHIEKAIRLTPAEPGFYHDLHLTWKREGKWDKAEAALDKALKLSPRNATFTASKAELALLQGDWERARRIIEPVRALASESASLAVALANIAPRFGGENEAINALSRLLLRSDVPMLARVRVGFALAAMQDLVGAYDDAWQAVIAANMVRNARGRAWDPENHRRVVDAAIEGWTPSAIAAMPRAQVDASAVVLVVGMPRCGNTLAAMLAGALPDAALAGELNDLMLFARELQGPNVTGAPVFSRISALTEEDLTRRANAYLARLRLIRPGKSLFVDRLPLNLLNLGLVSRMLPGAKIVLCARDPMDTAVACFTHLFSANYPFLQEAEHVGAFMREGNRLVAHWRSVLDLPIHDLPYEELLARPEAEAKRLAEFLGRESTPESLEPARRWISTVTLPDGSMRDLIPDARVGIAKSYERHTAPMRAALEGAA